MAGDASTISFRSHRKKLDDCFKFLNTSQAGLQTLKTTITDLGKWIAPVVNDRLHELEVLQTTTQARCDEIKETDMCLDYNGFFASIAEFKMIFYQKSKVIHRHVKRAIRQRGRSKGCKKK